ncbi:phage attachment tail tip protein J [Escherichia coli]|uniref:phage attachment tail tip protein J n=4 Tax=Escherichia coli TaxID=562 RepID=UPI0014954FD9|nr:host specificity protein J [Escherichia coli]EEU2383396.1 host specificity protein J [Escherichia coli]QKB64707.1 host specificity protein J [Escherichia coli O157:H7]
MGKGGGKAHTPVEAKDNLKSTQMMSVIDAIGEGPVEGPVKGLQSILVNKTPLTDTDGNPVIHGVTAVWRAGEQEQTPPEGFESSGSETALGVEVTKAKPVTRTITSANIDRLRVTFGVQSLVQTTSQGDRNPASVRLLIQLQRNGNWVTEKDVTINGKTTSQFLASVILDNLPPRPFNIRMVRETADSTTDQLQNKTLWSSYTEIIDVKQCYPNTAIVGLQVDAEQFGGQQMTVNYHIRGRIIQVPSNYDPEKRTYSGIWDGSLKPAYSNNPAWCLWDMLTHPRYGMGKRLGAADVDKWALYAIAQYCDQTVPDGFGGTEPRMTFNAYLSQQRKAWDVLSDFCSAMRCMPVWNGQTLTFVQDRPSDVVWPYTNSDVVVDDNGVGFRYSFSALKDRHTAVEVNYTDPQNGWQTSTELVEDPEAILRYGRNLLKMDAFGCTSRGQAHRAGLWVIKTGLLETQTVDFTLGSQGLRHTPGDIIEICDNDYAGTLTGGRVLSIDAATRTLTLDREVTLPETGAATVNLINGSGKPVSVDITAHPAPDRIQVSTLPDGVETYGVWGLSLPSLRRRLFRCVSIRENTDGTFAITAVQHVPEKEAIVDNGASFEPQSGTLNSVIPPAVQHLTVEVSAADGQYLAQAKWDTPRVVKGVRFSLRLTSGSGQDSRLVTTAITADTEHRFSGLPPGEYTLTVRAINSYGQQGEPATTTFRINAPAVPATIELTLGYFQITAVPRLAVYDPTVQFEFWFSETKIADTSQVETSARYLGTGSQWSVSGPHIKPGKDFWFYVRSVNLVGKSAFVEVSGQPSNDGEGYLEFFREKIGKLHLAQGLWELIDNSQLADEMAEMKTSITETRNEITQTVSKTLENQSATIQQIQRVQKDTNDDLAALYMLKVQKTKDGIPYVAGIGAGIEDTDGQPLSNILLLADRIAMINPENGNSTPLFVAQGNQLFMNDVFLKRLFAVSITSSGNPPTFSLTPEGRLTARNADISGNVNANSGTLNNVTINENCQIKGKLSANQIEGDIVKTVSKSFPRTNSYASGTITVRISDDQKFDRQVMIPPVLFRGGKHENFNSNNQQSYWYSTCRLRVTRNGQEIFNQSTTDAQGVFSSVIDMPAGQGTLTLTFTVSSSGANNWTPTTSISDLLVVVMKKSTAGISIS